MHGSSECVAGWQSTWPAQPATVTHPTTRQSEENSCLPACVCCPAIACAVSRCCRFGCAVGRVLQPVPSHGAAVPGLLLCCGGLAQVQTRPPPRRALLVHADSMPPCAARATPRGCSRCGVPTGICLAVEHWAVLVDCVQEPPPGAAQGEGCPQASDWLMDIGWW